MQTNSTVGAGERIIEEAGALAKSTVYVPQMCLVDLLDSWATPATRCCAAAWQASLRHTTSTTCSLANLHHDRIHDTLQFLLFCFEFVFFCQLVFVEPVKRLLNGLLNLLFVVAFKLILQLFLRKSVTHCEAVVLQTILCFNLRFVLL